MYLDEKMYKGNTGNVENKVESFLCVIVMVFILFASLFDFKLIEYNRSRDNVGMLRRGVHM